MGCHHGAYCKAGEHGSFSRGFMLGAVLPYVSNIDTSTTLCEMIIVQMFDGSSPRSRGLDGGDAVHVIRTNV